MTTQRRWLLALAAFIVAGSALEITTSASLSIYGAGQNARGWLHSSRERATSVYDALLLSSLTQKGRLLLRGQQQGRRAGNPRSTGPSSVSGSPSVSTTSSQPSKASRQRTNHELPRYHPRDR
jgi:hypothetical protein